MKPENIILTFLITFLIIVQFSLIFVNEGLWWDEAVYLGLGENIREGIYSLSSARPIESFRSPLFPIVASISGANSNNILASRLIPFIFYVLSIVTIFEAGKEFFSSKLHGLISALVLASFPLFVFYSSKFLTESLFVFLFSLSLLIFSKMGRNGLIYTFLLGITLGLLFLTRYIGIILLPLFVFWLLIKRKFKDLLVILIGFPLTISPWLLFNYLQFGNPLWGFISNLQIYSRMVGKPFHYYLTNSYHIFGPLVVFVVIGYIVSFKDWIFGNLKKNERFILFFTATIPIIFTLLGNKNTRYLVSFYPLFSLLIVQLVKRMRKYGNVIYDFVIVLVILLSIGNFYMGYQDSIEDFDSGKALKKAGLFLEKSTNSDDKILTQIYSHGYLIKDITSSNPWIQVIADRKPVPFPERRKKLETVIRERDAKYALIYNFGPRVPKYPDSIVKGYKFEKIKSFEQWNNEEAAVIYRYSDQSS